MLAIFMGVVSVCWMVVGVIEQLHGRDMESTLAVIVGLLFLLAAQGERRMP